MPAVQAEAAAPDPQPQPVPSRRIHAPQPRERAVMDLPLVIPEDLDSAASGLLRLAAAGVLAWQYQELRPPEMVLLRLLAGNDAFDLVNPRPGPATESTFSARLLQAGAEAVMARPQAVPAAVAAVLAPWARSLTLPTGCPGGDSSRATGLIRLAAALAVDHPEAVAPAVRDALVSWARKLAVAGTAPCGPRAAAELAGTAAAPAGGDAL